MSFWKCAQCKSTFAKSKLLESHSRQTKHKAYSCTKDPQCHKSFGLRTALIRHEASHSEHKKHVCSHCNRGFHRRDHALEHEALCGAARVDGSALHADLERTEDTAEVRAASLLADMGNSVVQSGEEAAAAAAADDQHDDWTRAVAATGFPTRMLSSEESGTLNLISKNAAMQNEVTQQQAKAQQERQLRPEFHQSQSKELPRFVAPQSRYLPKVISYAPAQGRPGTKFTVYLRSVYDFDAVLDTPVITLGHLRCQTVLTKSVQRDQQFEPILTVTVPSFSLGGLSCTDAPLRLTIEQGPATWDLPTQPFGTFKILGHSSTESETVHPTTNQRDYILDLADPERSSNLIKPGCKHPAKFQCHLCPKRFTRAASLREHIRFHTDEKPFVCTVCGLAFTRNHDRKRHEDGHSGVFKYRCNGELQAGASWGCGRRFKRPDNLGRHFRSEAGRVCIRPLLDEEAAERQKESLEDLRQLKRHELAYVTKDIALPAALLAQYPALASIDWNTIPTPPTNDYLSDFEGH